MIMVGDGNTGCFGAVAKSLKEKYGDDYNITKEELEKMGLPWKINIHFVHVIEGHDANTGKTKVT